MSAAKETTSATVPVWDWPIRLFHWSIVIGICVSWWSAENAVMDLHRYSGFTLLGLLVFRIYWGVVGSSTARFAQFVYGPAAILRYLRTATAHSTPGHNPLGGWSVIALLTLLLAQLTTGLLATDVDGIESGPLSSRVSFDTGRALAEAHETIFNLLLAMTALHIAAIAFYLFARRTNLITAMFTGRRASIASLAPIQPAPLSRIWLGVGLAVLIVWLVVRA